MTVHCDTIADALSEGRALGDPERSHAAGCPRCRWLTAEDDSLAALLEGSGDRTKPPAMGLALAALAAEPPNPVRLRAAPARALVSLAPGVLTLTGIALIAIRRDFSELSASARWVPVFALLALAALGVGLASARGRDNLGPGHTLRIAVAIGTFSVFEVLALAMGHGPWWGGEAGHHTACALAAAGLPAVLTPLTLLALRGTDPVHPAWTGASVGAAVAAVTAVIQHLECAAPSLTHVALSHGLSFVVGGSVGAVLGRRWLTP